jgi:hypothetical protein
MKSAFLAWPWDAATLSCLEFRSRRPRINLDRKGEA